MPFHGPPGDIHNLGIGTTLGSSNPWRGFLIDEPEIAYAGLRPQSGSQNFLNYWRSQQGQARAEQDYQTLLGQQAFSGQPPNVEFPDYLRQYDFQRRFDELSPDERGVDRGQFAPSLRRVF